MSTTIINLAAWRLAYPKPLQPDLGAAMAVLPYRVWHAAVIGYCQAWMAVMSPRGRS